MPWYSFSGNVSDGWHRLVDLRPRRNTRRHVVSTCQSAFSYRKGGSKEPDQQRFVAEVEDYIQGHFRRSFQTSTELKRLVKEAVMSADLGRVSRTGDVADGRIRAALNRRPPDTQHSVWMKTVWTTLRDEEVVDPLELSDQAFKQRVLRLGHECEPPLFSYERSKQSEATASRLRIVQGTSRAAIPHEDATILTIHA